MAVAIKTKLSILDFVLQSLMNIGTLYLQIKTFNLLYGPQLIWHRTEHILKMSVISLFCYCKSKM